MEPAKERGHSAIRRLAEPDKDGVLYFGRKFEQVPFPEKPPTLPLTSWRKATLGREGREKNTQGVVLSTFSSAVFKSDAEECR